MVLARRRRSPVIRRPDHAARRFAVPQDIVQAGHTSRRSAPKETTMTRLADLPLRTPEPLPTATLTRADGRLAAMIGAIALAVYGALAWRLAQGEYLDYYNLAFDFDPNMTVEALATSSKNFIGFKHPLIEALRPLAWPLLALGLDAKSAASLVIAGFGAASVVLCYLFLRKAGIERPLAGLLAALFAVSSTQLIVSITVETYGVAGFTIVLTWLVAQARLDDPGRFRVLPYVAGVLTFGTTITNVVQSFLAEALLAWHQGGLRQAILRCVRFGLILAVPIAVLVLLLWFRPLLAALQDPVQALKEVYWLRTKGEKVGLLEVLEAFLVHSFVMPHYTWVTLPGNIQMRDFREWNFPLLGAIAAPLWLLFLAAGTIGAFMHRRYRIIALGLAAALAFNLVLHLDFQFRGSLYLYTSHAHFLVLGLAAGLAPHLSVARPAGRAYAAAVLLLTLLLAANNLPIAAAFTSDFDVVNMPCPKPCFAVPEP
jgi:hypothetical protein